MANHFKNQQVEKFSNVIILEHLICSNQQVENYSRFILMKILNRFSSSSFILPLDMLGVEQIDENFAIALEV